MLRPKPSAKTNSTGSMVAIAWRIWILLMESRRIRCAMRPRRTYCPSSQADLSVCARVWIDNSRDTNFLQISSSFPRNFGLLSRRKKVTQLATQSMGRSPRKHHGLASKIRTIRQKLYCRHSSPLKMQKTMTGTKTSSKKKVHTIPIRFGICWLIL